jgi:IMP cyclohydrolase
MDRKVVIGPLGSAAYDALRHYSAVQFDDVSGVAAVSNGIQTEAIFEAYRLLYNVKTEPTKEYLRMLMEGANYEPDSLNTPRIGGAITNHGDRPYCFISIKRRGAPADVFDVRLERGILSGMSVYDGALENPKAFDPSAGLQSLKVDATNASAIARQIFDISAATNKGQDIRVCCVSGVMARKTWDIAIVNAHES